MEKVLKKSGKSPGMYTILDLQCVNFVGNVLMCIVGNEKGSIIMFRC